MVPMRSILIPLALSVGAPALAEPAGEREFRAWYRQPANRTQAAQFERYLARFGVRGVLPTGQILRTASDWRRCGSPFEVPPVTYWARIVPVLRFIRDEIKPRIGAVEAVSGYRNPVLNRCAAGAPRSAHVGYWGLDLVPRTSISRPELFRRLCGLHRNKGRTARFGLGFYRGLRFHVDTKRYRLWGSSNRSGTSPCL